MISGNEFNVRRNRIFRYIKRTVESTDTIAGKCFDWGIQSLLLISVVTFCLETVPQFADKWGEEFRACENVTVLIFTAEYVLRIIVSDRKRKAAFGMYGIVDLISILPFYLSTGFDLRSLRAIRFLRLVAGFKLIRYSRAMRRYKRAFLIAREELVLYLGASTFLFFAASVIVYYCERDAQPVAFQSIFHSMWWSVITLTTVGYGDVCPVTPAGKVATFCILMIGLGVVALPAGIFASALTEARKCMEPEERGH